MTFFLIRFIEININLLSLFSPFFLNLLIKKEIYTKITRYPNKNLETILPIQKNPFY